MTRLGSIRRTVASPRWSPGSTRCPLIVAILRFGAISTEVRRKGTGARRLGIAVKGGGRIGSGIRLALAGNATWIPKTPARKRSERQLILRAEEGTIQTQCVNDKGCPVLRIVGRLEVKAIPVEMPRQPVERAEIVQGLSKIPLEDQF